jgi:hypothetical protein
MKYQEYRLKRVKSLSAMDNVDLAKNLLDELMTKENLKPTEAAIIENFIFILPQNPQIDGQSTLEIKTSKQRKQAPKAELRDKQHQEKLDLLEKEYNLKQKDINKIHKIFNQLVDDKRVEIDDLSKQMKALESVTIDIVNDKELKLFFRKFNNHINGLRLCLETENTKFISNEEKVGIVNKLDILQSFMDDFKKLLLDNDKNT